MYMNISVRYLLEQHSESFKIWSGIIRINTTGKSLFINLGPGLHTLITPQSVNIKLQVLRYTTCNNFVYKTKQKRNTIKNKCFFVGSLLMVK